MKFSYRWIGELVEGLDVPAQALERLITVHTAECEGVHATGALLEKAHAATVLEAVEIAGTHLRKALVDVGRGEPVTVVCGASNCRAGLKTVWVDLGFKTIQGIASNGMLASANELEIGKTDGIIECAEAWEAPAPDSVIEIDNKSLTHRPDLWGHLGMAREVAAITEKALRDPVRMGLLPEARGGFAVEVEDFELCPRFSAIALDGITVAPSPFWLQQRLIAVGINPISNIVDVTNFVMAELAQPMHAFDRDKLRGDRLVVRRAEAGEGITALDHEEYALAPESGLVCDGEGPVSIAGIIGGLDSAIGEGTTRIVLEAASWKASAIRKTSSALKIRTDASMRFEKAQDPRNTVRALARALELIFELCPGARVSGGLTDVYQCLPEPVTLDLDFGVLNRKLGRDVEPDEVRGILERLGFGVDGSQVTVPSWRATKDVSMADDLVEEVGRMIGYDTITPRPPMTACVVPPDDPARLFLRKTRALIAARGFTEIYLYSFLSDAQATRFGLPQNHLVRVLNPIASDQNLLRSSLIPGISESVTLNARFQNAFRIFEIGREIHKRPDALPDEIRHLCAAIYTSEGDATEELLELKRLAESVAPGCVVKPADYVRVYEHPARTATVWLEDQSIGSLFELHPSLVERGRAAILDLDLDAVLRLRKTAVRYSPIRRFPSTAFDVSVICGARALAADIEHHIRQLAGDLLDKLDYVREYAGPQVGEGRKSVTYRITLNSPVRTLESEEAANVRARVFEGLPKLGYEVRA